MTEISPDLQKAFDEAVKRVNSPEEAHKGKNASNELKLDMYKYYKQANFGDVTGAAPWKVQLEASAKYNAWKSIKGMSKAEAMQKYVEIVNEYLGPKA